MGYYTNYNIEIQGPDDQANTVAQHLEDECRAYVGETFNSKWYSWKQDCLEISTENPDVTIHLYGEGEEADDQWKARIRNGKIEMVQAVITFPDFKEIV